MQRYSKKRQAILDCLRGTSSHPTAEWIYEQLQPEYPDLSLATVYRNLGQFKQAGVICSVGIVDGHERFDANTAPHSHAVCSCCGAVTDIEDLQVPAAIIGDAERETDYRITEAFLQFKGVCADCRKTKLKNI